MKTECCGLVIAHDWRFCPKCGHEARIVGGSPITRRGVPMTGKVARLKPERGFGFIKGEDGRDYFFHQSHTHCKFVDLKVGDAVAFEVLSSLKGPRAERISRT